MARVKNVLRQRPPSPPVIAPRPPAEDERPLKKARTDKTTPIFCKMPLKATKYAPRVLY